MPPLFYDTDPRTPKRCKMRGLFFNGIIYRLRHKTPLKRKIERQNCIEKHAARVGAGTFTKVNRRRKGRGRIAPFFTFTRARVLGKVFL